MRRKNIQLVCGCMFGIKFKTCNLPISLFPVKTKTSMTSQLMQVFSGVAQHVLTKLVSNHYFSMTYLIVYQKHCMSTKAALTKTIFELLARLFPKPTLINMDIVLTKNNIINNEHVIWDIGPLTCTRDGAPVQSTHGGSLVT